jgi:hypothetical protein
MLYLISKLLLDIDRIPHNKNCEDFVMRIICPYCHQKAAIQKRHDLNDQKTVSDLYCHCLNITECGATFVFSLAFKHPLNPPLKTHKHMALDLVSRMSKQEKMELQRDMFV